METSSRLVLVVIVALFAGRLAARTPDQTPPLTNTFESRPQKPPPPPPPPPKLAGTTWQLVTFQGGDGKTLTPDDRSKYVIELGPNGQVTARVDCNRGRGTWKSSGTNQLVFGPLALTRAKCPEGSLHDQIVKQWTSLRSFVIKDNHLFLSLMADGGIYEFEPIPRARVRGRSGR